MFDSLGENLKALVGANSHGTIMVFAGHQLGFGSLHVTGEVLKAGPGFVLMHFVELKGPRGECWAWRSSSTLL